MNMKKRQARAAANAKYDNLVKASIKGAKRESMQSQELLRAEMQNAYKTGAFFFSSLSRPSLVLSQFVFSFLGY